MQISPRTLPLAMALRSAKRALPLRGWNSVFGLLFPPGEQEHFEIDLPLFEQRYRADAACLIDWLTLFHGAYEAADVAASRAILAKMHRPVVLDVGANVGHHTLAFAALAGHVHAFEPYAPVRERLAGQIERNRLTNVTVHPYGLGRENGTFPYAPPAGYNTGVGRFSAEGSLSLEIRVGDEALRQAGIDQVHFIKIDTEGHERDVLQGLRQTIERCYPVLLVEAWSMAADLATLLPPGYQMFMHRRGRLLDAYTLVRTTPDSTGGNLFCLPPSRLDLLPP